MTLFPFNKGSFFIFPKNESLNSIKTSFPTISLILKFIFEFSKKYLFKFLSVTITSLEEIISSFILNIKPLLKRNLLLF